MVDQTLAAGRHAGGVSRHEGSDSGNDAAGDGYRFLYALEHRLAQTLTVSRTFTVSPANSGSSGGSSRSTGGRGGGGYVYHHFPMW